MNSLPPEFPTSIFNSLAFGTTGNLTKAQADRLYLSIAEGQNLGLIASITPGVAVASKALIVDSSRNISNIGSLTASKSIANQNDSSNATVAYPLEVVHSLSSGSPSVNNFGSGVLFNGPNASNNIISYSRMYSIAQVTTTNAHQGNLTLSTVFAGNFVDTLRLSCLTSANNTLVQALGSNSTISAINLTGTLTTAAQPSITSVGTLTDLTVSGNINGTIATASQANITTLGSLTGLTNGGYYNASPVNVPTGQGVSLRSINLNDHAIYFRGTSSADVKHGLMYSGYLNASWNSTKGFGNGVSPAPSVGVDGPVLFGNTGVMIGNMAGASNTQTICASFVDKSLTVNEKINIGTRTNSHALNVNEASGNCLRMIKADSTTSDFRINVGDNGVTTLQPRNGLLSTSYALTLVSSNSYLKTGYDESSPFYAIDLRGRRWGIDARMDGDDLVISSGSGWKFYSNSTAGILDAIPKALIDASGILVAQGNIKSNKGVHANGFENADLSGPGAHMHYASDRASFFGYDYTTLAYKDMSLGDNSVFIKAAGQVGVGTTTPTNPLHVVNAGVNSSAGTFGFLNSSGSGSATGFTNRSFTIRSSGGILCDTGEIDVLSDERVKKNFSKIDEEEAVRYLEVEPKQFQYRSQSKDDQKFHVGYKAQDLMRAGLTKVVAGVDIPESEDSLEESQTIECFDGSVIEVSDRKRLVVSVQDLVPYLHILIKISDKKIKEQAEQIAELYKLLEQKSDKRSKKKED